MPEVEMRYQISGARDSQLWPAKGGRLEVSDDEADHLVRTGAAKLVETADAAGSETATAVPDTGLTTATVPTVETATA